MRPSHLAYIRVSEGSTYVTGPSRVRRVELLAPELFFLILAHSVYRL